MKLREFPLLQPDIRLVKNHPTFVDWRPAFSLEDVAVHVYLNVSVPTDCWIAKRREESFHDKVIHFELKAAQFLPRRNTCGINRGVRRVCHLSFIWHKTIP